MNLFYSPSLTKPDDPSVITEAMQNVSKNMILVDSDGYFKAVSDNHRHSIVRLLCRCTTA